MAIAQDATTPAGVSQTSGTTATVATGSFSPPSGSVLVVCWVCNTATTAPSAPSISNTGGLTFALANWRSKADSGGSNGQAAIWTAPAASAPGSMTVTVTTGSGSGDRHARIRCGVYTGVDLASPVAATNEGTDTLGALDNLSYTSSVANSVGIAAVSDWDVTSSTFTGASGTTVDDSASVASAINAATLRQTTPTTSGSTVTLGLTSPTSTSWNWVWVELRPDTSTPTQPRPLIVPGLATIRAATW